MLYHALQHNFWFLPNIIQLHSNLGCTQVNCIACIVDVCTVCDSIGSPKYYYDSTEIINSECV